MTEQELCEVFEALYRGELRDGWTFEDFAQVQTLGFAECAWARSVGEDGTTGAWTQLAAPCQRRRERI